MYSFYLHCLRSPTNLLRRYSPSFQSEQSEQSAVWAVVTGPTKGIGLSMANKLAARGFSILLVGRSLPRLKHVKEKIDNNPTSSHSHHSQVDIIHIDFSKVERNALKQLNQRLSTIDIGVLVNNVGTVIPGGLKYFTEILPEHNNMVQHVNMRSCVLMTRLVLPKIVARGSGGVINMSSLSGLHSSPLLSMYAASKAFVHSLSMSLSEETSGLSNIDVLSVTPGFVSTDMSSSMFGSHAEQRPPFLHTSTTSWCSAIRCPPVVTADTCAESILCQLGNGQRHTSGHWTHSVQRVIHSLTPSLVLSDVTHTCMRTFRQTKTNEKVRGGETKSHRYGDEEEDEELEKEEKTTCSTEGTNDLEEVGLLTHTCTT
jgi:17beta-estradiol 17-dehydrogenase / very-long-chain 3-oxoacyl-CoA reductase